MTQHHFEHDNATPAEGANRADRHPPLDEPASRLRAVNWLIGALIVILAAYVASK